jgi:hypothetical protein
MDPYVDNKNIFEHLFFFSNGNAYMYYVGPQIFMQMQGMLRMNDLGELGSIL